MREARGQQSRCAIALIGARYDGKKELVDGQAFIETQAVDPAQRTVPAGFNEGGPGTGAGLLGAASVQAAQRDDLVGPAFQVKGRKSFLQAGAFLLGVIREEVSDEFRARRRQRYRLSLPARLRMGPELGERQSILRDRIRYSDKRQIAVGGDADELIRHERRVVLHQHLRRAPRPFRLAPGYPARDERSEQQQRNRNPETAPHPQPRSVSVKSHVELLVHAGEICQGIPERARRSLRLFYNFLTASSQLGRAVWLP